MSITLVPTQWVKIVAAGATAEVQCTSTFGVRIVAAAALPDPAVVDGEILSKEDPYRRYDAPLPADLYAIALVAPCEIRVMPIGTAPAAAGAGPGTPLYTSAAAANFATAQAPVAPAASVVCPGRAARRAVTVQNLTTTPVWIGPPGVTPTTGILLPGAVAASVTIPTAAAIAAVTAAGAAATVAILETY